MTILKNLFTKKAKVDVSRDELISMNVCPNCWGKREYQREYSKAYDDSIKTLRHKDRSDPKTFIQQFVETNITGIRLNNNGHKRTCPSCNTTFK